MSWKEKEWKVPRKGDVVKDLDGNIGVVSKTQGILNDRILWVEDEKFTEIYSGELSSQFTKVEVEEVSNFYMKRYELQGFKLGALCSFKGDREIPLEIIKLEWNFLRNKMIIGLKDLREFDSQIMKTENDSLLEIFEDDYPPIENMYNSHSSNLKYRLEVNLIEKESNSWENTGSPWEFLNKQDAIDEVEAWKSRLKVRRVSSVLSSHWKISFPCWTVEAKKDISGKILTRVKRIDNPNGSPGYFETALHASLAMKLVSEKDWQNCFFFSQDGPII